MALTSSGLMLTIVALKRPCSLDSKQHNWSTENLHQNTLLATPTHQFPQNANCHLSRQQAEPLLKLEDGVGILKMYIHAKTK